MVGASISTRPVVKYTGIPKLEPEWILPPDDELQGGRSIGHMYMQDRPMHREVKSGKAWVLEMSTIPCTVCRRHWLRRVMAEKSEVLELQAQDTAPSQKACNLDTTFEEQLLQSMVYIPTESNHHLMERG